MRKILIILFLCNLVYSQNESSINQFWCKSDHKIFKVQSQQTIKHEFDILFYDITVNWYYVLKNSIRTYPGQVRIIARVDTANSLSQVTLHSYLTIDSIIQNNSRLTYSSTSGLLTINLDRTYYTNEIIDMVIYFRRTQTNNVGFYYYPKSSQTLENLAYTMTEPTDARYWFPCYDDPSDKADSLRLSIIVPNGFTATGNGLLENFSTSGDSSTFIWFGTYPITTYLIAITASKYSKFTQYYTSKYPPFEIIEIQHYQWQSDSSRSVFVARNLGLMMECFETYYGKYPFEKYGHTFVSPFSYGGMEHQTISTLHRNWLTSDAQSGIAHELAHQWWGDMVTCETWKDIWLNEGFATFSEDLYKEYTQGKTAYFSGMNSKANYYYNYNPGYAIYNPPYIFNAAISYYKGALVLNMLRYVLGDSLFFQALNNYRNQFLYSTATTNDFKNVVSQTVGEDFSYFFNQWVYQPDHPNYVYNWNVEQSQNTYRLNFILKQRQTHYSVYKMPFELKIQFASGDTTIKIWNTLREQSYQFEFTQQPTNVVVDPQNYILKQITRDQSLDVSNENDLIQYKLYQNYPNPFNSQTTIKFSIPNRSFVTLKIFNLLGKEIKTIVNEELNAGTYSEIFDAQDLPSGIYFYELTAGEFKSIKKFVLMK